MPVSFSKSVAMVAACGDGSSTVIDLPASGLASSARAGAAKASTARATDDKMSPRMSLFS